MNATKERQAWCCLQVKLCDPRLSALSVVTTIKALYKYTSFLFFPLAIMRFIFTYLLILYLSVAAWYGTETVQVTQLRRTLASSP